ncbi:MAG TPA: 7-carboxy-7-deazaguanine synthase QueE [Candidatus Binatia bacterium]|nr:7-carboxy-7-deazaguanine synthase QueE [Candidatus Binatia bacterium]
MPAPDLKPLRVNEIFLSVQGEGVHVGERTVFLRLYGCPLRCVWCDQPEALATSGIGRFETMSPDAVLDRILHHPSVRRLCLTGGEPLIAPAESLGWLLGSLRERGWWISVETSGSRVVEPLMALIDFWTISPKGESARTFEGDPVEAQLPTLRELMALPEERRQLKFVIQSEGDVNDAVRFLDALEYRGAVVLQPEHGSGDGRAVFEWWPWDRYPEARIIPQTHKAVGLR